eukprot:TRINITY_DN9714_c0_g2_i1.p1 TRINITY_DN9714_c0_g2~~TRINITY_DN9714_c0_g2_i1.p1  ORF type:complete len:464 (+),score=169.00 TRINITY_DN9714_c0_g2_i1:646-2037(+)
MKKNNTFLNKLKRINAESFGQIEKDVTSLDSSKFIDEIVAILSEVRPKSAEIPYVSWVISLLHQRYDNIALPVVKSLAQQLLTSSSAGSESLSSSSSSSSSSTGDGAVLSPKEQRNALKLIVDVFECGVFDDPSLLYAVLKSMVGADKQHQAGQLQALDAYTTAMKQYKDTPDSFEFQLPPQLALITTFLKACSDFLRFPREDKAEDEDGNEEGSVLLQKEQADKFYGLVDKHFANLLDTLSSMHETLVARIKKNNKILSTKGVLLDKTEAFTESLTRSFENFHNSMLQYAMLVGKTMPDLSIEQEDDEDQGNIVDLVSAVPFLQSNRDFDNTLWDSEETRQFYEELPDFSHLPSSLLTDTKKARKERERMQYQQLQQMLEEEEQDGAESSDYGEGSSSTTASSATVIGGKSNYSYDADKYSEYEWDDYDDDYDVKFAARNALATTPLQQFLVDLPSSFSTER